MSFRRKYRKSQYSANLFLLLCCFIAISQCCMAKQLVHDHLLTRPGGQTVQFTQFDPAGHPLTTIDENGQTVNIAYADPQGLPTNVHYVNSTKPDVQYAYNADGSLQQLITPMGNFNYQYNTDGQLIGLRNPAGKTSRWAYRPDGLLTRQTLGNKAFTNYSYDAVLHLTDLRNTTPNGRLVSDFAISGWNGLDNITGMTANLPGLPKMSGSSVLSYDNQSQLTQSVWTPLHGGMNTATTQNVSYDAAGNPTTFPRDLPGYTGNTRVYDANNRWVGYRVAGTFATQGTANFVYDPNGNPTTYKGDTLSYDVHNALTSYTHAAGTTDPVTFGYRSDGLRAWKQITRGLGFSLRTYYFYAGGQLLYEMNGQTKKVTAYNTWGPTGLLNRTNLQTNQEIWYLFDPQGNVAERLDASGHILSSDQYDAWGSLLQGGDATDPYGYHAQDGYYTDHETGLILCTLRYYDPQMGRWLTPDPAGQAGGMNLYAYCGNNPINLTDPLGLCSYNNSVNNTYTNTYTSDGLPDNLDNPNFSYGSSLGGFVPAIHTGAGYAKVTLEVAASLTPEEQARQAIQGTGTFNEKLSTTDRVLAGAGVVGDGVGAVAKLGEAVGDGVKIAKGAKVVEKAATNANKAAINWKSVLQFGHTFMTHGEGEQITASLIDRARLEGPQGQWLNNEAAANFLDQFKNLTSKDEFDLPKGLGQIIRKDGSIAPATRCRVIPWPNRPGFRTAYPIE